MEKHNEDTGIHVHNVKREQELLRINSYQFLGIMPLPPRL